MKKTIFVIIFCFMYAFTFFMLFKNDDYSEYIRMIEDIRAAKIVLSYGDLKVHEIYDILKSGLNKYNGNIYCDISTRENDTVILRRYAYFTNIELYRTIKLSKGRYIDISENESECFISTVNTDNKFQVGNIMDFAGNHRFEIRTLKNHLEAGIFDRVFYLQVKEFDNFVTYMNDRGIFIQKSKTLVSDNNQTDIIIILTLAICFTALILLILFDMINSFRKIAIEKMIGYSIKDIWKKRIFPIIIIGILSMLISNIVMCFIFFKTYNHLTVIFIIKLGWWFIGILIVTVIILSITLKYVKKIKIIDMLKNRRPIEDIIGLNTAIKIIFMCIVIILTISQIDNFKQINVEFKQSYSFWEETKKYYTIGEFSTIDRSYSPYSEKNQEIEKELFFYFNEMGALYADFSYYSKNFRENNQHIKEDFKLDYITVNPNYLEKHEVIDENGNKVAISEQENEFTILVPESYHDKENELTEYYCIQKKGYINTPVNSDEEEHKHSLPSNNDDNRINIIWVKSGQKYFSYRVDIKPEDDNCVVDPIVRVITESNGKTKDYNRIIAYNGKPFKIKVPDTTTAEKTILSKLNEYYNAGEYNFPLISVYDNMKDQILKAQNTFLKNISIILFLCIVLFLLILQNCISYFDLNKVKIIIRNMLGYKKTDMYISYFVLCCSSWIVILILSFLFKKSESFFISSIFFTAELFVSWLILERIVKRNINLSIKGW